MSKKNRSHPHAAPVVPKEMPQTRDEQAAEQLRQDELAKAKRDQGHPGPLQPPAPTDENEPPPAA